MITTLFTPARIFQWVGKELLGSYLQNAGTERIGKNQPWTLSGFFPKKRWIVTAFWKRMYAWRMLICRIKQREKISDLGSGGEAMAEPLGDDDEVAPLHLDTNPLVLLRLYVIVAGTFHYERHHIVGLHRRLVELLELNSIFLFRSKQPEYLVVEVDDVVVDNEHVAGADVPLGLHSAESFFHLDSVVQVYLE